MNGPILIYGAYGVTGGACVAACEERRIPYVVAGRDGDRLRSVAGPRCVDVRVAEAQALASALDGVGAVLSTAGPFLRCGEAVLDAAVAAGVPYTDTTAEAAFVARAVTRDGAARTAGVAALPACGVEYLPMLLGAARLGPGPVETWLWLDDFVPTPGSVRSMVAMAGRGASPRPRRHRCDDREGWHVAIPGVEAELHHPDSATHLMLGRWEAAPFRWLWPLARGRDLAWLGDVLADRLPTPSAEQQAAARFTVVVSQGDRAVRYDGEDVYRSTARFAMAVAAALARGEASGPGVRSVGEALDVDALEAAVGLVPRWVAPPRPG